MYYYIVKFKITFINFILYFIGPIHIIYIITDEKMKNITLEYYSGKINSYTDKTNYYVLTYSSQGKLITTHTTKNIRKKLLCLKYPDNNTPKLNRKKWYMYNNNELVHKEYDNIDDYHLHMSINDIKSDIKYSVLLPLIGYDCTHIIKFDKFKRETVHADNIKPTDLYII
jgi:hypothetical protein